MRRTLTSALPHATAGDQVLLQARVHRRRSLAKVTFLVVRDRSVLAQGRPAGRYAGATGGDDRLRDRRGHAQRAGARGRRGDRGDGDRADRAGRDPAVRALATEPHGRASRPARPLPRLLAPSRAAREVGAGRGQPARLPQHPRRPRLHRDPDPEVRRVRDRERRQRVRGRLLRPAGVPRPEPAVLQAAAGRRLRARLRGRAGVPRRAPRHRAPPRGVRLARRRARLHPRPPRRPGDAARGAGRDGRRHPRACGRSRGADGEQPYRRCRRSCRCSTPETPWPWSEQTTTSPTSHPSTSARSAPGPRRSTAATSSRSRATRWRSGRSTPTPGSRQRRRARGSRARPAR